jgi:hypothetical protein
LLPGFDYSTFFKRLLNNYMKENRVGRQGRFATNNLGGWRKTYRSVLIGCLLLLPVYAWSSEAALRVAFVYNFLKFIEWPQSSSGLLNLCALGAEDEMRQALDQLANKTLNKRPILLTHLDDNQPLAAQLGNCQLVYWPGSARRFLLPQPLPVGVVLVADEANAHVPGVSIALLRTRDGRIEFTVNKTAVEQAGVRISSQLLKLDKTYRDGANSKGGEDE